MKNFLMISLAAICFLSIVINVVLFVKYNNIKLQNEQHIGGNEAENIEEALQLEAQDFSITDGKNFVQLDLPYDDFAIDEAETDVSEYSPNHLVTEEYKNETLYKFYFHEFKDFTIYTSNYKDDWKNNIWDEYYIIQITLNGIGYQTARGIAIGADAAEVASVYGEGELKTIENGTVISYYMGTSCMQFYMNENDSVKEIIMSTIQEENP